MGSTEKVSTGSVSTGSATGAELPSERYDGPADVSTGSDSAGSTSGDGVSVQVQVRLRGHFEPLDGRFHWYGRISADATSGLRAGTTVSLTTPHGSAVGWLSDVDPWGRLRISGTGRPPF